MIGEREEVVAVLLVPIGDHLGIVIAIAPQRMGVQVALPSACRSIGGRSNERDEGESESENGGAHGGICRGKRRGVKRGACLPYCKEIAFAPAAPETVRTRDEGRE